MTIVESKESKLEPSWILGPEAMSLVAGKTDKPGGIDPATWFRSDPGVLYALARIPLSSFAENEDGDRYDGTVERRRAQAYASLETQAPPVIAIPSRDGSTLRILDGGHRMTAARMRGDHSILAIVRVRTSQLNERMRSAKMQGWAPALLPDLNMLTRLEEPTRPFQLQC